MMTSLKKKFRSRATVEDDRDDSDSIRYEYVPQHVLKHHKSMRKKEEETEDKKTK